MTSSAGYFTAYWRDNKNNSQKWGNSNVPSTTTHPSKTKDGGGGGDTYVGNIIYMHYEWGIWGGNRMLYLVPYSIDTSIYAPFGVSTTYANGSNRSYDYSNFFIYNYSNITTNETTAKNGCNYHVEGTFYIVLRQVYKAYYNADGGSGAPSTQDVYAGIGYNLSTTKPTRGGYTFSGWRYGSTNYASGENVGDSAASGSRTYYANWTQNTYIVDINIMSPDGNQDYLSGTMTTTYSDGNQTFANVTDQGRSNVPYYTTITITNITPASGMALDRVYCNNGSMSSSGSTYTYRATMTGVPSGSWDDVITIQMKWASYTLYYNSNGGTSLSSKSVTYNSAYGTLATPTKTGYTFAGWYKESGLTNQVTSSTIVTTIGSHYIYAKWNVNYYNIDVYRTTGISDITNPPAAWNLGDGKRVSMAYGSTMVINVAMANGYIWSRWGDSSGNTITTTQNYTFTVGAQNYTFYAYASLKTFYININILNPDGGEDSVSGTMDLQYPDGTKYYNQNNEPNVNGSSKTIKYGQSITISNIIPANKYGLRSVYCNYGSLVDRGDGTYVYTATNGSLAELSAEVIYIKMTYAKYDSVKKYFYIEDGEFPQSYVGDEMNLILEKTGKDELSLEYNLPYNNGVENINIPVYTYKGQKYAYVNSVKNDDKEWIATGSNFYTLSKNLKYENAITINLWGYMTNWADYEGETMRMISCTEGGGWNIECYSSDGVSKNINFACYEQGYGYNSIHLNKQWSSLAAGWHMFTMTFDGNYVRAYIDGEYQGMSSKYNSGKIGYNQNNTIFVGAEAGSSDTIPAGQYFSGKIKNLEIRNFCLTAKNIADLYGANHVFERWFKVEPIRWRISDYGVSKTESAISKFYNGSTHLDLVSELVLGFGSVSTTKAINQEYAGEDIGKNVKENWGFKNSELYKNSEILSTSEKIIDTFVKSVNSGAGKYAEYEKYNLASEEKKVVADSSNLITKGMRVSSISEINGGLSLGTQAKASDMVSFLIGCSNSQNVDYWTRNLYNLGSGYICTSSGIFKTQWLNSACGVRYTTTIGLEYRK